MKSKNIGIGHALWIAVAITMLILLLAGGAVAENSYEFVLKIPSSQQWNFYSPSGIAVDSSGNFYVTNRDNDYIQKFSASGGFLAKWGSNGSGDGQFWSPGGVAVDSAGNVYVADSNNHRIQKFSASGVFLAKWGSYGGGDGQFNYPHEVTVDNAGNVYVADSSNSRIQKFSASGGFLAKWGSYGSGDGQFWSPGGIAVDNAGNVYVTDIGNNRIQKFSASGGFLAKWGSYGSGDGQFSSPRGIAVDSARNIYVADGSNTRIQKFSGSGGFLAKWGSYGKGDSQFIFPEGIAVDSAGNVYVADSVIDRIQKFSASGGFLAKWGSYGSGDGQFQLFMGVAVDNAGNVYVADTENARIQKFSSSGGFLAKWGLLGIGNGQFNYPKGIAVDSAGNVYVADTFNHRIQKFSASGGFLAKWGSFGSGDGQFNMPGGIALDSVGNIYVADTFNHRIQKFSASGGFLAKWGNYGSGGGQLNYPDGVAVDSAGNVYVTESNGNRIQKFSASGVFLTKWGSSDGQIWSFIGGTAVDSEGNIYVSDTNNHRIQKFSASGGFLAKWGSCGSGDYEFKGPEGIAVDSAGNVYVADSGNHRIQKFTITTVTPTPACPQLVPPYCPTGTIIPQGIDPNTGCQKPSICVTPTPTSTPNTGSIAISSTPSGASIYLDGVYKGTTPKLLTDVSEGSHTVKLILSGHNDWSYTTLVSDGGISRLSAELTTSIPTPTGTQTSTPAAITKTPSEQLPTQPPSKPIKTPNSDPVESVLPIIIGAITGLFLLRRLLISDSKDSAKYRVERSLVSYYLFAGHIILGGFFLNNFYWVFTQINITEERTSFDQFQIPVLFSVFSLFFLYTSFSSFILAYGALKLKPLNKTARFHILLSLFLIPFSFFYYLNTFSQDVFNVFIISSEVLLSIALSAWQIRITKFIEIGVPLVPADSTPTTTIKEPVPKEEIPKKGINIASAFGYKVPAIIYKVKIENNTSEPISDIKVHLFVPEVFLIKEKEKTLSMLEPKESKTVTFEIRPTGECGDCFVSGKMEYYDYITRRRKILDIEAKTISVVCPVLKRKEIDVNQWEQITDGLIKAEENIKELSVPAENLFNIISRVIKDNSMFMLKPEITSTPQLFNGIAMFYAEGVTGLRYAAYIEVVGGARKSRLILKIWAEKEEALTGFYHRILDDIEKRTDVKIFIDDTIVQQQIHIGDSIGTQVKDSFVQRSNIGSGEKKCPECGREVEANEKFCNECGARL